MKEILKESKDVIYITDNNDNTALFYSKIDKSFSLLYEAKIDINHINKNGDNLLIYCCKNKNCQTC